MIAIWSEIAGVLVTKEPKSDLPEFHYLGIGPRDRNAAWLTLSALDDWEEVDIRDREAAIRRLTDRYWTHRTISNTLSLLQGLSSGLQNRVLDDVEEDFKTRVKVNSVLNRLLAAPLLKSQSARLLAQKALTRNLAATAKLFDQLADLQPLLSRFVEIWLTLSPGDFVDLPIEKTYIWRGMISKEILLPLIQIPSRGTFMGIWTNLMTDIPATSRPALAKLGNALAAKLFPEAPTQDEGGMHEGTGELPASGRVGQRKPPSNWAAERDRALRQVDAIADAVAQGKDSNAHKFLKDLIRNQLAAGDAQYVSKSLCNIAQRCSEMFRTDFERECLEQAVSINPTDSWTLIQWGDHLKRTGQFADAIAALEKAWHLSGDNVAKSSIADVWAKQGDNAKALGIYQGIPHWEDDEIIRTAIADLLRRGGDLDGAEREYEFIIEKWKSDRAYAGKAEIAKRRLDFEKSLAIYETLITNVEVDDASKLIYRLARCNLWKMTGNLDKAYADCDRIVQEFPFLTEARIQRGAILALLGNAQQGLLDVPYSMASSAFGEWMRDYYRGLMLLKLDRYQEAKQFLIERLDKALATGDERLLIRLGAAVAFLSQSDFKQAEKSMQLYTKSNNLMVEHLASALRLHIALLESDEASAKWLLNDLSKADQTQKGVANVVRLLSEKQYKAAVNAEIELLLAAC